MLDVGTEAPEFELPLKAGEAPLRLADYRGEKAVVLLFFPLAFSSVCTDELCSVADEYASWADLGAEVLGVSVDSAFTNQRFAADHDLPFPLLSDFNEDAMTAYEVRNDDYFGLRGVAYRSAFVIDQDGIIRYAWMTEDDRILPDFEAIRSVLRSLD